VANAEVPAVNAASSPSERATSPSRFRRARVGAPVDGPLHRVDAGAPEDLACVNCEGDAVQCLNVSIALAEIVDGDRIHDRRASPRVLGSKPRAS
jgi:hypothetical protein